MHMEYILRESTATYTNICTYVRTYVHTVHVHIRPIDSHITVYGTLMDVMNCATVQSYNIMLLHILGMCEFVFDTET